MAESSQIYADPVSGTIRDTLWSPKVVEKHYIQPFAGHAAPQVSRDKGALFGAETVRGWLRAFFNKLQVATGCSRKPQTNG
jgi:hypothetical protein